MNERMRDGLEAALDAMNNVDDAVAELETTACDYDLDAMDGKRMAEIHDLWHALRAKIVAAARGNA